MVGLVPGSRPHANLAESSRLTKFRGYNDNLAWLNIIYK